MKNSSHHPPGQVMGHMQAMIAPMNLLKFVPTPWEYLGTRKTTTPSFPHGAEMETSSGPGHEPHEATTAVISTFAISRPPCAALSRQRSQG